MARSPFRWFQWHQDHPQDGPLRTLDQLSDEALVAEETIVCEAFQDLVRREATATVDEVERARARLKLVKAERLRRYYDRPHSKRSAFKLEGLSTPNTKEDKMDTTGKISQAENDLATLQERASYYRGQFDHFAGLVEGSREELHRLRTDLHRERQNELITITRGTLKTLEEEARKRYHNLATRNRVGDYMSALDEAAQVLKV